MQTGIVDIQPQNEVGYDLSEVITPADRDEAVLRMFLFGRPESTVRAYKADLAKFKGTIRKSLATVTLDNLQFFAESLRGMSTESQRRTLSAVKSLFSFAFKIGYLRFNPAAALLVPKPQPMLSERILSEDQVRSLLASLGPGMDRALVVVLYGAGLRISEAIALNWGNVVLCKGGGFITVKNGKGGKTRTVRISSWAVEELKDYRPDNAVATDPVFVSEWGRRIGEVRARARVKAAAIKAGLPKEVSCHWMRHCSASHALQNGAPIHVVQQSLGHASLATTGKYLHVRPKDCVGDYLPKMEKQK